ncbi:cupin domain-containing protein [Dyadobacter sp. CY356]|uniref:cupin domain-containing protein n=1 Tax=Dyadobacter sp. CY356 TaxID=2906442 RepID=UPI001F18EA92|nr:cupin domain-containing protein [Dyadobacter sp. CY356]MCF0056838.1 cupin domain-containing protein [Dyadobacter sp. CY356]
MSEVREFIESGILEMYVRGDASPDENALVELMATKYHEVKEELYIIEVALENYALSQATTVDPVIKPFLMATVEYMERIGKGEKPSFPPKLHANSLISDFEEWLNRPDLALTEPLDEIDARIICATPEKTTAIVWIKNGAPPEIHKDEYETFLIVEGSCNIIVDGEDNHLKPGDVFTIPLYLSHTVIVTSEIPCKLILERLAA